MRPWPFAIAGTSVVAVVLLIGHHTPAKMS
jgi:hypothetical protein